MMRNVSGIDAVVAEMGEWNPAGLAFIDRIEFGADDEAGGATLKIMSSWQRRETMGAAGWPDPQGLWVRIGLRFRNVGNLRIVQPSSGRIQVSGFQIDDIADRGWESYRLEIADYEDGRIAFLCASAEVVSVMQV